MTRFLHSALAILSISVLALASIGSTTADAQSYLNNRVEPIQGNHSVYISSQDYPPDALSWAPKSAVEETKFYTALNEAVARTGNLSLVSESSQADYKAIVTCGGITHCSKVKIDLYNQNNESLATDWITGRLKPWHPHDVEGTAQKIASTLSDRIGAFDAGGYGAYDHTTVFSSTPNQQAATTHHPKNHTSHAGHQQLQQTHIQPTDSNTNGIQPGAFDPPMFRHPKGWNVNSAE